MEVLVSLLVQMIMVLILSSRSSASALDTLAESSFLSVEKPSDILVSANGIFSAGFLQVGDNAFCFSIWFTTPNEPTIVWMANRDRPVNGRASKLSLLNNGNLILVDARLITVWTTMTSSDTQVQLKLMNNGNLVLQNLGDKVLWQSFESPTDTLLPDQFLTQKASLISSRNRANYSSGYYTLYFDTDNVLKLLYRGPNVSSIYWPYPGVLPLTAGRSTYNVSKTAVLDSYGHFRSSDTFEFYASDNDTDLYRRLVIDSDGNLRLYTLDMEHKTWDVSWQAVSQPCSVHGICGPNSMCTYDPHMGRTCYCLQGYKVKNPHDWSQGCEAQFNFSCNKDQFGFLQLRNVELYGYDMGIYKVSNLKRCEEMCFNLCENCKAFQFAPTPSSGMYNCYPKMLLLNGRDSSNVVGDIYLRLPKTSTFFIENVTKHIQVSCSGYSMTELLNIAYENPHENQRLTFLLWFACSIGGLEITCIILVMFLLFRTSDKANLDRKGVLQASSGFKRFTYGELKTATSDFQDEIGRGATGIVYKARLCDGCIAAVKRLNPANEEDHGKFVAEISTIGRLNHMNLIKMWGYCAEKKHRLLVYEYMESGSLTKNLISNKLDWGKRFNIAVGIAKGLAYLHEECLESIFHCDVKPENILLDPNYEPKVADFGLSKLLRRDGHGNFQFSRIRGTRGYMAPEWIYKLHITSKVDVYSYGMLLLEMVTGRSPIGINSPEHEGNIEQGRLVKWVRDRVLEDDMVACVADTIDLMMNNQYDGDQVALLLMVALQCVKEDVDARPSMSQVVKMLLSFKSCP